MNAVPADVSSTAGQVGAERWGLVAFTVLIAITPAMPHANLPGGIDPGDITTLAAAVVGLVAVLRSGAWRRLRPRRAPRPSPSLSWCRSL